MPEPNFRSVFQLENSSLVYQGFEGGAGSEGLGTSKMRKRQVVVRRSEEPSRSSTISSSTVRNVKYGECQKNHAASVGGYAVDGCREFMASGEEGTAAALTCAACGCHRNFHRREVETEVVCDCSSPSSNVSVVFRVDGHHR
ncbi:unnamed protein product [Dovyalis caffra]|uniref:ZF-HD dimerization-type domain-containing protein n=1 Tax=Dovyalis caffra TaxID=77055 RepID=A0AAV1R2L3_9ROSI|nr:unnamed protein product [Dovyalis caffra]